MSMTEPIENTPSTPWQGDWKARLQEKLSLLGFHDLEEFLDGHPGLGYVKLATLLGDANVAAMQLYGEQIRRGCETNNIRAVAMDCLVRFINEYVPRGWKNGRHFQTRSASAYAAWSTSITFIVSSETSLKPTLKRVFENLNSLAIPVGWLPKDKDDVFVVEAFETGWPSPEKI